MTRKVNLRQDVDVALLGIRHNFLQILLCVPHAATIFRIVKEFAAAVARTHKRPAADAAHFRQFRIFRNLHAPALVVSQVLVQHIQFIYRHHVDNALHLLLAEEVARHVQHKSAIPQLRLVLNLQVGHFPCHVPGFRRAVNGAGHHLFQRLQAVKETPTVSRLDYDGVIFHHQAVRLLLHRVVQNQVDGLRLTASGRSLRLQTDAGSLLQLLRKPLHLTLHVARVSRHVGDGRQPAQGQCTGLALFQGDRIRNDAIFANRLIFLQRHELQRVVRVVLVPKAQVLTHAGSAKLIHRHRSVAQRLDFISSVIRSVGRSRNAERIVAV